MDHTTDTPPPDTPDTPDNNMVARNDSTMVMSLQQQQKQEEESSFASLRANLEKQNVGTATSSAAEIAKKQREEREKELQLLSNPQSSEDVAKNKGGGGAQDKREWLMHAFDKGSSGGGGGEEDRTTPEENVSRDLTQDKIKWLQEQAFAKSNENKGEEEEAVPVSHELTQDKVKWLQQQAFHKKEVTTKEETTISHDLTQEKKKWLEGQAFTKNNATKIDDEEVPVSHELTQDKVRWLQQQAFNNTTKEKDDEETHVSHELTQDKVKWLQQQAFTKKDADNSKKEDVITHDLTQEKKKWLEGQAFVKNNSTKKEEEEAPVSHELTKDKIKWLQEKAFNNKDTSTTAKKDINNTTSIASLRANLEKKSTESSPAPTSKAFSLLRDKVENNSTDVTRSNKSAFDSLRNNLEKHSTKAKEEPKPLDPASVTTLRDKIERKAAKSKVESEVQDTLDTKSSFGSLRDNLEKQSKKERSPSPPNPEFESLRSNLENQTKKDVIKNKTQSRSPSPPNPEFEFLRSNLENQSNTEKPEVKPVVKPTPIDTAPIPTEDAEVTNVASLRSNLEKRSNSPTMPVVKSKQREKEEMELLSLSQPSAKNDASQGSMISDDEATSPAKEDIPQSYHDLADSFGLVIGDAVVESKNTPATPSAAGADKEKIVKKNHVFVFVIHETKGMTMLPYIHHIEGVKNKRRYQLAGGLINDEELIFGISGNKNADKHTRIVAAAKLAAGRHLLQQTTIDIRRNLDKLYPCQLKSLPSSLNCDFYKGKIYFCLIVKDNYFAMHLLSSNHPGITFTKDPKEAFQSITHDSRYDDENAAAESTSKDLLGGDNKKKAGLFSCFGFC